MRCAEKAGGSRGRALTAPRIGPAALALLVMVLSPARRLSAQTSDEVQKAADGAIRRLGLQTEFPRVPEPANFDFHLPPETLWVVVALAVAILLYTFREQLMALRFGSGSAEAWAEQEGEVGAPTSGNEALVLEAADELAAAGRFVEAMHVLLLQGLGYIRRRLNQQLSDSLTSREILYSTNLPQDARAPLRDVIARVELTYFGERPAGLADYTACRESFHALAQALQGSAA